MDTAVRPFSDDLDLDALMLRVRDAAAPGTASGGSAEPPVAGDANTPESDVIRVLEAQGDWNEHAGQSLATLVDCIRTLRDDWTDVQARLRREIGELSALVEQLRSAVAAPVARPSAPASPTPARRRAAASPRGTTKRRPAARRRTRS